MSACTNTYDNSSIVGETVIIKTAPHFRIKNERDILRKFQPRTPYLRPLVDEIIAPRGPRGIVLKHLEDDLQTASAARKLNGREIRYISKRVLNALKVLHESGYVHTGQDQVVINLEIASFSRENFLQISKWITFLSTMLQVRIVPMGNVLPTSNLQTSRVQCT